jgi:hypothetical protein
VTLPLRDPMTGDLNFALSVHVHVAGQLLPLTYDVSDWRGLRAFLAGREFRDLADRVQHLTVTNRAAP